MTRRPQGWNDLAARGVDLGAGMLRAYGEAARGVATGRVSYRDLTDRFAAVARDEGGAYARGLAQAAVDYWARVFELGADFQRRVLAGDAPAATAAASAGGPGVGLDFTGAPGEVVARAFVVQNSQPEPVDVSFEASAFASGVRPDLAVEPAAFRLEPGQDQVVACRLTLDPALPRGRTETARLRVIGFPGMEIGLTATVV